MDVDPHPVAHVKIEPVCGGFMLPFYGTHSEKDTEFIYVCDRIGDVYRVSSITGKSTLFFSVQKEVVRPRAMMDQRGLLGLALHPQFETNGRFFVTLAIPIRPDRIRSRPWDPYPSPGIGADRDVNFIFELREYDSENIHSGGRLLLDILMPSPYHPGGWLKFDPKDESLLYVSVGDSSSPSDGDSRQRAQNPFTLLGKILCLNIEKNRKYDARDGTHRGYGIPRTNTFFHAHEDIRKEIFALGFCNASSLDIDESNDFRVVDWGAGNRDGFYHIKSGDNCGWPIMEGSIKINYEKTGINPYLRLGRDRYTLPIYEYVHTHMKYCMMGGDTYYAHDDTGLHGQYIFGDFGGKLNLDVKVGRRSLRQTMRMSGEVYTLSYSESHNKWIAHSLYKMPPGHFVSGFGNTMPHAIHVLTVSSPALAERTGRLYRFVPSDEIRPLVPIPLTPLPEIVMAKSAPVRGRGREVEREKFTIQQARVASKVLRIDYRNVQFTLMDMWIGMNIEAEHGSRISVVTNVTRDNPVTTAKIAYAHLKESPYYYRSAAQLHKEIVYWRRYWQKKYGKAYAQAALNAFTAQTLNVGADGESSGESSAPASPGMYDPYDPFEFMEDVVLLPPELLEPPPLPAPEIAPTPIPVPNVEPFPTLPEGVEPGPQPFLPNQPPEEFRPGQEETGIVRRRIRMFVQGTVNRYGEPSRIADIRTEMPLAVAFYNLVKNRSRAVHVRVRRSHKNELKELILLTFFQDQLAPSQRKGVMSHIEREVLNNLFLFPTNYSTPYTHSAWILWKTNEPMKRALVLFFDSTQTHLQLREFTNMDFAQLSRVSAATSAEDLMRISFIEQRIDVTFRKHVNRFDPRHDMANPIAIRRALQNMESMGTHVISVSHKLEPSTMSTTDPSEQSAIPTEESVPTEAVEVSRQIEPIEDDDE